MPFLVALILGALSALAFEPFGLIPLMPLAFAGLCALVRRAERMRGALLLGWGFGVGQFCIGLNWIATAFTYQAAMPAWLGWVAVVLLSLYLAVYPMLGVGLAWRFGRRSRVALVLALAGGWAVTEWLRGTMFTGFAWNPVGVVLVDTPWRHASATVGTFGLSAAVVAAGGALWLAAQRQWRAAAIGAALLAGLLLLPRNALLPIDRPAVIRIVQPNIGQEDKWREGLADEAAAKLERLSVGPRTGPRLLFWPEVAVIEPLQLESDDGRPLPLQLPAAPRAARSIAPGDLLLTGGFALSVGPDQRVTGNSNSVFALDPAGAIRGRYDKAHLVPYGEYLPMRPLLSRIGLSQLAPGQGDTASGPGPRTLDLGAWGRMGVQICYEIIFPGAVIDRANRPEFLFNPSNDAWFGRWGPPQHLAQARLRAAEEGIPVIRSTPTGISALIDARGTLLQSLPWRTAGVIDGVLPPAARPTLFARTGNALSLALAFSLLLGAIALHGRARYKRT